MIAKTIGTNVANVYYWKKTDQWPARLGRHQQRGLDEMSGVRAAAPEFQPMDRRDIELCIADLTARARLSDRVEISAQFALELAGYLRRLTGNQHRA